MLPERNDGADLGGQSAELVAGHVQVLQPVKAGDVRRQGGKVVVVDVKCREVGEPP